MTDIVNHRTILRTLRDHGECSIPTVRGHLGPYAPRQTVRYYMTALESEGCVTRRQLGDDLLWCITPRGERWLSLLETVDADTLPMYRLATDVLTWLMEHPGEHRILEIKASPEIAPILADYVADSVVASCLTRLHRRGLVTRRTSAPMGAGRPPVYWSIADAPKCKPREVPKPKRRVPRDAPPGYWDEHWEEIESRLRTIMIGRRPMLQVTLKRELGADDYPQGLIREAVRRGLISVSWSRGQQYYTLVG